MDKQIFTSTGNVFQLLILSLVLLYISSCRYQAGEIPEPNLPALQRLTVAVRTDSVLNNNITTTTALVSGKVFKSSRDVIKKYGFYYSATKNLPTADDLVFLSGETVPAIDSFNITSRLASLSPNTAYFIRAFAIVDTVTIYGSVRNFTTTQIVNTVTVQTLDATNITFNGALAQGILVSAGAKVSEYGFIYSLSSTPSAADKKIVSGTAAPATYPLSYSSPITGLAEGTVYYIRSYVVDNSQTYFGEYKSFATPVGMAPAVTTNTVSDVSFFTASVSGSITSKGSTDITEYGFVYSKTNNSPTTGDIKVIQAKANPPGFPANFTASLSGLDENSKYNIRTYAINAKGTAYGEVKTFTTLDGKGKVTTSRVAYDENSKTITAGGSIESKGASDITRYGFVYATTTSNPTLSNTVVETGTSVNAAFPFSYSNNINTFTLPAGVYYIRSFVTNASGTSYGNILSVTVFVNPSVTTGDFTVTRDFFANLVGTINSQGSAPIQEYGFLFVNKANASLGFNYGDAGVTIVKGSVTPTAFPYRYSIMATPFSYNTTYTYKAYVKTTNGLVYGVAKEFIVNF